MTTHGRQRWVVAGVAGAAGFLAGAGVMAVLLRAPVVESSAAGATDVAVSRQADRPVERVRLDAREPARSEPSPVATPPPPPSALPPSLDADPIAALRARQLRLPIATVDRDDLQSSFTDRRGDTRRHEAIDILAPRNTPVLAVEAGTVARLFESKAGGITVYQYDPHGRYVYYYAHLERYASGLDEGDIVRPGQILGYVGTSGNAPPNTPHLHFAIFKLTNAKRWWEGTPIDPYAVLK